MRSWVIGILVAIFSLSVAVACPDGQYEGTFGWCYPELSGPVPDAVQHIKGELQGQLVGLPLEQWISASRNTAINGSMPIPPLIRQELTGYASDDSMNRVRYKIGDNGFVNLANVLEKGGFASAVTLVDVIVFRGPSEANDPSIWAHELTHVDQYTNWGVHSFAIQYARDYNSVESPAYAKGDGYWAWWTLNHGQGPPGPANGFPAQAPQGFGNFCYTSAGRFGPGPMQPLGSQCFIQGPGLPTILGSIGT